MEYQHENAADELATLSALRTWAQAAVALPVSAREANATDSHARGYRSAARDVLAILGEDAPGPQETR